MKTTEKLLALMLIIVIILAGCGKTDSNVEQEVTLRTDIKLNCNSEVTSLDPYATTAATDTQLIRQMYEGLMFLNDDMELEPRIAESYEISEDGMVYTFKLRKGVKFHNGDELKASDVVFSFNRAMNSAAMANRTASVDTVTAVDENTVKIKTVDVMAAALNNIAEVEILSEKIVTEQGDNFGQTDVDAGTGPYYITSYDRSTKITMAAFEDYYRGAGSIKDVEYRVMTDSSSTLIAFESGELDLITVPLSNWNEISSNSEYQTTTVDTTHISYIAQNISKEPFDNINLRKAIAYAINKEAAITAAYEGLAVKADCLLNPACIEGAPADGVCYNYDPDKAKEYLAEAGYPDGIDIGELLVYGSGYWQKFCEVIQQNLSDVGIKCELQPMDTSAVIQNMKKGDYGIGNGGMTCDRDAGYLARFCHSRNAANSAVKYNDSYIDETLDKSDRELDSVKRKAIIKEVNDYVMETAALLPVFYKTTPYAWAKNLEGSFNLNYYYIHNFSWK